VTCAVHFADKGCCVEKEGKPLIATGSLSRLDGQTLSRERERHTSRATQSTEHSRCGEWKQAYSSAYARYGARLVRGIYLPLNHLRLRKSCLPSPAGRHMSRSYKKRVRRGQGRRGERTGHLQPSAAQTRNRDRGGPRCRSGRCRCVSYVRARRWPESDGLPVLDRG
jgi:hypothetical protein